MAEAAVGVVTSTLVLVFADCMRHVGCSFAVNLRAARGGASQLPSPPHPAPPHHAYAYALVCVCMCVQDGSKPAGSGGAVWSFAHYIISEHATHRNGRFCADNRDHYLFGKSQTVPLLEAAQACTDVIGSSDVLVFHHGDGDVVRTVSCVRLCISIDICASVCPLTHNCSSQQHVGVTQHQHVAGHSI